MITQSQVDTVNAWLKDLRSGKYKQGTDYLTVIFNATSIIHHCCLGVLSRTCKVKVKGTVSADGMSHRQFSFPKEFKNDLETDYLDMPPAEWFKVKTGFTKKFMDSLATLNDNGMDFEYIAKVIERNLKRRIRRGIAA